MHLENRKLHVALIVALGLLVYINTFSVPFFLDDYTSLVNVPLIKNLSYFVDLDAARSYKGYGGFVSRYFGYLTFALNYRLGGLNVFGYHVVNLAIHIMAALALYRLVLVTFRTPFCRALGDDSLERRASFTALLAALLFVVHPLQTQAVTYLVQRFASLSAMLYLLCIANYAQARVTHREQGMNGRTVAWYVAAFVAGILAVKTKETSYTLPFAVVLYEIVFVRERISRKMILASAGAAFAAAGAGILFLLRSAPSLPALVTKLDAATRLQTDMSRIDYMATQCRVVVTYLRLLVVPVGQQLDYDFPVSAGFGRNEVFCLVLLIALFGLAVYLFRRSGRSDVLPENRLCYRLAAFGVFWFFLTLAIESSIIPIVDVIFEHRMYLPSAGIFVAAAALLSLFAPMDEALEGWPERRWLSGVAVVLLLFGVTTVARNQLWRDEVSFWQDNAEKAPEKARVFLNLGRAQERRGDLAGAEKAYSRANALDGGLTDPLINLGLLYIQTNRLDQAMEKFRAVLVNDPKHAEAHNNIGKIYGLRMQLDEALKEFVQASQLKPNLAEPYNNIGFVHALRREYDAALKAYGECLSRDPDYVQAYVNRGMALVAMGKKAEARADFEHALDLDPGCGEAAAQLQQLASSR